MSDQFIVNAYESDKPSYELAKVDGVDVADVYLVKSVLWDKYEGSYHYNYYKFPLYFLFEDHVELFKGK